MEVALCICHPQHRLSQKEQSREVSWECLSKPGDVPGSPSQPYVGAAEIPVKIRTGFLFFTLGPLLLVLLTAHFSSLLPRRGSCRLG